MQLAVTPEQAIQAFSVSWSAVELVLAIAVVYMLIKSSKTLRFKGVRAVAHPLVVCIGLTLALSSAAEGVSAVMNAPLYVDVCIWAVCGAICFALGLIVYASCPNLKTRAVAALLGLSPLVFLPQRAAVKPVVEAGLSVATAAAQKGAKTAVRLAPTPTQAEGIVGLARKVTKADQLGWIGETATVRHFESLGDFKHLKCKLPRNHGFDAVFETTDHGMSVIYLVEAKTNTATLSAGQMSNDWIAKTCERMLASKDLRVRHTGQVVRTAMEEGRLRRVLSQVDTDSKTITLTALDESGTRGQMLSRTHAPDLIDRAISDVIGDSDVVKPAA